MDSSPVSASGTSEPGTPRCKRIMAVLGSAPRPPEDLIQALEGVFGAVDYRGEFLPFDTTDYYAPEFGPGLRRGWVSFRGLDGPENLPLLKLKAAELERRWGGGGRRSWNLDIGYMDPDKVVLASFKRGPCKLYLGNGVYADLLLKYAKGRLEPMPWAFADFKDGRYDRSLLVIREKLKAELHKVRVARPEGSP